MKKERRLDIASNHQILLLEKYYDVDKEKKEINVKIYYDKASELLDFAVGDVGHEMFNNAVLEKINSITEQFPADYKANVYIVVSDFENYTVETLTEKLIDIIDINNYQIIKGRKINWFIAAMLAFIGFILLVFLGIARQNDLFGEGLQKDVFEEMLDITSWVFVWQAVTVLFLTPSSLSKLGFKIINKVNSIIFSDKELNTLCKITRDDILENWDSDSKISTLRRATLLISSTIILALGFYQFIDMISSIKYEEGAMLVVFTIALSSILSLFYILAGLGGLFKYLNKGNFRTISKINSSILGILLLLGFVGTILLQQYQRLASVSISLIFYFIFIISIFWPDRGAQNGTIQKEKQD